MKKTKQEYVIGVDLGGTNLRAGVVNSSGRIISRIETPIGDQKSWKKISGLISDVVGELKKKSPKPPRAIGAGVPGIVDFEKGIVIRAPQFPNWKNVRVRGDLERLTGLPSVIDNDANMHAVGESKYGAGKGRRNFVLLTLGSGIGGGLVLDGRVYRGDFGFAGEVGHIVVEPEGFPCNCGGKGCLELYAASRAFGNIDNSLLTPAFAAHLARGGNRVALKLWKNFGYYLGIGIATLVNVLGIETFVIGGGISKSWGLFIAGAKKSALAHTYSFHSKRLKLIRAKLGGDAGIIGSAACASDCRKGFIPCTNF